MINKKTLIAFISIIPVFIIVVVIYNNSANGILNKIENIDYSKSTIINSQYLESYIDSSHYDVETKGFEDDTLKIEVINIIENAKDFNYVYASGIPVGYQPLISITLEIEDNKISISFYGDLESLDQLNIVIITHNNSSANYSKSIKYSIQHDDFIDVYELFYEN